MNFEPPPRLPVVQTDSRERSGDVRGRNIVIAETVGKIVFEVLSLNWRVVLVFGPLLIVIVQPWWFEITAPALILAFAAAACGLPFLRLTSIRLRTRAVLFTAFAASALCWALLGPFWLTSRGSFVWFRDGFAPLSSQRLIVDIPGSERRRVVVLSAANPVQRMLARWVFRERFVRIGEPFDGRSEFVRLPLSHMHRRFDGAAGRVSLFHPAPLVGRRYQVDTTLSVATYASVEPIVSGFYGQAAGDAAWDDVGLSCSVGSMSQRTIKYLVLLTVALNDIGSGRANFVLPSLAEADKLAYAADLSAPLFEQARVAMIRAFLSQRLCSGNLGLLQSAQYVTLGMDLHRRIRANKAIAGSAPLNSWITGQLREAVQPFTRNSKYRGYLNELQIDVSPGFAGIEVQVPKDHDRLQLLSVLDQSYVDPETYIAPSVEFAAVLQKATGTTLHNVVAMIEQEQDILINEVDSDSREGAQFRISVLQRILVNRLTLSFGTQLFLPIAEDSQPPTAAQLAVVVAHLRSEVDAASRVLNSPTFHEVLGLFDSTLLILEGRSEKYPAGPDWTPTVALRELVRFMAPDVFSEKEPPGTMDHSTAGWAHPSFQRAFTQYLIASIALREPRSDNLQDILPFLRNMPMDSVRAVTFLGASSRDEPFLPGLVWYSLLNGAWNDLPMHLQRIDFSLTDLATHLRPGLPEEFDDK